MAILISSPVTGSLKITNTAASPLSNYLVNNSTVNVGGDPNNQQQVFITNEQQDIIFQTKVSNITTIGASTPAGGFTMQNAIDAIASLLMH
jgi:hypothetical protein